MTLTHLRRTSSLIRQVCIQGDHTTIRLLLAWASFGWTVGLWVPWLHTFDRPIFVWMRAAANEWVWGALFLLHWAGVMWRVVDEKERVAWGLAINALGFGLWLATTSAQMLAVGEYTPTGSLEWVATAALFVVMMRTGRNVEIRSA